MDELEFWLDTNHQQNEIKNVSFEVRNTPPSGPIKGQFYYSDATNNTGLMVFNGLSWKNLFDEYLHYIKPSGPFTLNDSFANAPNSVLIIKSIKITAEGHIDDIVFDQLTLDDLGGIGQQHTHNTNDIVFNSPNRLLGSRPNGTTAELTVNEILFFLSIAYGDLNLLQSDTSTQQRTWTALDLRDFVELQISTLFDLDITHNPNNVVIDYQNGNNTGSITLDPATNTLSGAYTPQHYNIVTDLNSLHNPAQTPNVQTSTSLDIITDIETFRGHVTKIFKNNNLLNQIIAAIIDDNSQVLNKTWSSDKIANYITQTLTGALVYQAVPYNASNTQGTLILPIPEGTPAPPIKKAMVWVVTTGGYFGNQQVEPGDMIIALVDSATTESNFQVINKNIDEIHNASELLRGIIQIITTAEIDTAIANNTGEDTKAITLTKLMYYLDRTFSSRGYSIVLNGATNTYVVNHGLDTLNIIGDVYLIHAGLPDERIRTGFKPIDNDNVQITFNNPPNNSIRVVITRI